MCVWDMCIHHGTCVGTSRQLCSIDSFFFHLSMGRMGYPQAARLLQQVLLPTEASPWLVVSPFLVILGRTP